MLSVKDFKNGAKGPGGVRRLDTWSHGVCLQ